MYSFHFDPQNTMLPKEILKAKIILRHFLVKITNY